jgi:hypothetical protein
MNRVVSSKNGSMLAVLASGMSCMSEASIPFHPAIDEPSKAWPDVNLSSSKCEIGTVTCCSLPRVSVKRKSTNLTSFSFTIFITSATVLAIKYSCCTVVKKGLLVIYRSFYASGHKAQSPLRILPCQAGGAMPCEIGRSNERTFTAHYCTNKVHYSG